VARRQVTAEREIPATADEIFEVIADPSMHPVIDGSGTVRETRGDVPARLREGTRFGMNMRMGVPYIIRNVVVEYEEGRLIAWRHWGRHRWRWELEPRDGTTRVRHTFDWSTAPLPIRLYIEGLGIPEKNRRAMERTLERLEEVVTSPS
jgi:uncharacterized protein YndB with AHSA1/START domain